MRTIIDGRIVIEHDIIRDMADEVIERCQAGRGCVGKGGAPFVIVPLAVRLGLVEWMVNTARFVSEVEAESFKRYPQRAITICGTYVFGSAYATRPLYVSADAWDFGGATPDVIQRWDKGLDKPDIRQLL